MTAPTLQSAPVSVAATGPIGCGALVRVAAFPLQTWQEGGAPELFARLDTAADSVQCLADAGRALASRLGEELVPHPDLQPKERAAVLQCRRALHRGEITRGLQAVAALAACGPDLARALTDLHIAAGNLSTQECFLDEAIATEEERLLAAPWRLLHEHIAGRHAMRAGDVTAYADIASRVAAGEPWDTKRMRQRADYLWRILARAATRPTPRGWLAHTAALQMSDGKGWDGTDALHITAQAAVEHAGNLDHVRASGTTEALLADPALPLTVTPLHRHVGQHLVVWTLSGQERNMLGELRLRLTPALDAVRRLLSSGPTPADELATAMAAGDPQRRQSATALLTHLVGLGALQVAPAHRGILTGWSAASDTAVAAGGDDYVDVYRRSATGLDVAYSRRMEHLVGLARRVGACADADEAAVLAAIPGNITEQPRPLLELAAECVVDGVEVRRGRSHHHDWPAPRDPASPYAHLVQWIGRHADYGDVDIDDALLPPEQADPWPVDCLLRPLRGTTVLDQIAPAGFLDARFLPALAKLGEPLPQASAYHRFLHQLSASVPCVEVLAPPLSSRAANAVRRPCYTTLWTGDPNRSGYLAEGDAGYLPLADITLRRAGSSVIAESPQGPIWPVVHTTRAVPPPWGTVVELLMLASPQPERTFWRPMPYALGAFPDRDHLPRITVGSGALVISLAQWRVRTDELWRHDDPLPVKARALAALRRSRSLPRLVHVTPESHVDAVGVDMASLNTLRLLDRWTQRGVTNFLVREFPADVSTVDAATGGIHAAELLLRLPAQANADQVAATVQGRLPRLHGPPA